MVVALTIGILHILERHVYILLLSPQELISLIKNTKIPVICMCNDRNSQKIRSLANYCFDLRFQRPRVEQIKVHHNHSFHLMYLVLHPCLSSFLFSSLPPPCPCVLFHSLSLLPFSLPIPAFSFILSLLPFPLPTRPE